MLVISIDVTRKDVMCYIAHCTRVGDDKTYRGYLLEMKYENGSWSKPQKPSFADTTADDYYPSFSADGKKLYFSSRKKAPSTYPQNIDMRMWEVERTVTGWGKFSPFDTTAS